ncbi:MAG: hypothetical protein WED85_02870 [Dehalococcoidia bacterium]
MEREVRRIPPRIAVAIMLIVVAVVAFGALASASTTFEDAFDRSRSTTLGQGWQEVQGDQLIQGNELRSAAGITGTSIAIQPSTASSEQTVSAMFASSNNNSVPVLGLVLRYESPQAYYAFYRLVGGTSVLRIAKVSNGQELVLAQLGVPNPSVDSFFTLSATAIGNNLSLRLNGGQAVTVSDSSIASGAAGILLGSRTTNPALRLSQRSDNFSATGTTSGPPMPRLAVSLASNPSPQSVAPGVQGVTFTNVVLDAGGSAEDVWVGSLELDLETDSGATNPDACQLFDGVNVLTTGGNVVNPSADGTYAFTLDNVLIVPMQAQKNLRVGCNVPAGAAAGDTIEWRLSAADAIDSRGATSGEAAVTQVQASQDNQNKVTVHPVVGGTEAIDLTELRAVLRAGEISLGSDLGEQAPGYPSHFAMNFEGQSPPNTAWLSVCDQALSGDATVCADMLDSEINGEQCGGVAALVTEGASGRAIVARSCDAKGTDMLRLGVLNTATGVVTPLVNTNLFGRTDTYGGSVPPANCDHHQNQADYHMYCQWVRTCLTVATNQDGTVTFTARSWLRGSGPKNDPSRNDPNSAALTLIGTATWTGPRPGNVAASGKVGLMGTATQAWERASLTNLAVDW